MPKKKGNPYHIKKGEHGGRFTSAEETHAAKVSKVAKEAKRLDKIEDAAREAAGVKQSKRRISQQIAKIRSLLARSASGTSIIANLKDLHKLDSLPKNILSIIEDVVARAGQKALRIDIGELEDIAKYLRSRQTYIDQFKHGLKK